MIQTTKRTQEVGPNSSISVFVHRDDAPSSRVLASENEPLLDVLARAGVQSLDGMLVTSDRVGGVSAPFDSPELPDVLDPRCTLQENGIGGGGHIACCPCQVIDVSVNYQNQTRQRRFRPVIRVENVTKWARIVFGVEGADGDTLTLFLCGNAEAPRPTQSLSELVQRPSCSLCFDLLPDPKINGGG